MPANTPLSASKPEFPTQFPEKEDANSKPGQTPTCLPRAMSERGVLDQGHGGALGFLCVPRREACRGSTSDERNIKKKISQIRDDGNALSSWVRANRKKCTKNTSQINNPLRPATEDSLRHTTMLVFSPLFTLLLYYSLL